MGPAFWVFHWYESGPRLSIGKPTDRAVSSELSDPEKGFWSIYLVAILIVCVVHVFVLFMLSFFAGCGIWPPNLLVHLVTQAWAVV